MELAERTKNNTNNNRKKKQTKHTPAHMDTSMKIHNEPRHIIFNAFVMLFVCH